MIVPRRVKSAPLQIHDAHPTDDVLAAGLDAEVIADLLVAYACAGSDVGDLLAVACRTAAKRLEGAVGEYETVYAGDDALVAGRPGSWEAEHVRALAGGWEYQF